MMALPSRFTVPFSLFVCALAACAKPSDSASSGSAHASVASADKPAASSEPKLEPRKEKSITAKFCLGADGTSQDCGISCKVDKDPETCAKWAEKTKAICGKITKAECQDICVKDENPTACDIAKTMK